MKPSRVRWGSTALVSCLLLAVLWLALPASIGDASLPAAHVVAARVIRVGPPAIYPALTDRVHAYLLAGATTAAQTAFRRREALAVLHSNLWLHGIGSQLFTAWGAPMTLKAINWFGFEYAPFVPDGLDHTSLDTILGSLRGKGFNSLRLPFANETVEKNPVVTTGLAANPELHGLHALDIMQRVIERAHYFGLRVVLCNTRSEAGRGPELITGLWYTSTYSAAAWVRDWLTLARRFRADSAFVGADLRNEPHITGAVFDQSAYFRLGPLWGAYHGTYYHDRDWHYAAQEVGNALLGINPHLLIIVEGVQMYLDPYRNVLTGGLWGANLVGVQYDPIVLSRPGQLVYSVHEYGPHMWQGNWFSPHTTYASLARRWDHLWGYLLTAQRALQAPIFVGEFGTCHDYWSCISNSEGWKQGFWFQSFVRYLKEHPEVGWAYWSLNPTGPFHATDENFYSLVSPDWKHYFPLVIAGLAPLLAEPSGLWNEPATLRTLAASRLKFSMRPGCSANHSCTSVLPSRLPSAAGGPRLATAPPSVSAVRLSPNQPYVQPASAGLRGDLYLPQGHASTLRPAVIIVHGQNWDQGGKGTPATIDLARSLAWHGYVVFDINYRLVGYGGRYPRDIRDVKDAVAFLALKAGKLRINAHQIALVGADAGAYLALMAAYTPNGPLLGPKHYPMGMPRIAAVGSFFAPSDLEGIGGGAADPLELARLSAYLRAGMQQHLGLYRQASVQTYAGSAVPTIFFHGRDDTSAPFVETFRLYRYLKQRTIRSQLIDLPAAPHGFGDLVGAPRRQVLGQLISFFDSVFYQPPVAP